MREYRTKSDRDAVEAIVIISGLATSLAPEPGVCVGPATGVPDVEGAVAVLSSVGSSNLLTMKSTASSV